MSTGGNCEKCGRWFKTQRYEDQGYGLCTECEKAAVELQGLIKSKPGPSAKILLPLCEILYELRNDADFDGFEDYAIRIDELFNDYHRPEQREEQMRILEARCDTLASFVAEVMGYAKPKNIVLPDGREMEYHPPDALVRQSWNLLSSALRETIESFSARRREQTWNGKTEGIPK